MEVLRIGVDVISIAISATIIIIILKGWKK